MKRSRPYLFLSIGLAMGAGIGFALGNIAIGAGIGTAIGAGMMGISARNKRRD